jgi:hypothetical protein
VVAFAADLGQGEELAEVAEKARATGADEVYIEDLKEEFVRDFVWPMFRANALYEGAYLLGTSIARPLIAKAQVEVALRVGADALSHGATGKGNDQVRFELTYRPWPGPQNYRALAEWDLAGRAECVAYAEARHPGVGDQKNPIPATGTCCISASRAASWKTLGRALRTCSSHRLAGSGPDKPHMSIDLSAATRWQWTARLSAPPISWPGSTRWAASTASAGWTWWKTVTWA